MIIKRTLESVAVVPSEDNTLKLHIIARTRGPINAGDFLEYEDLTGGIYPEAVALDLEHVGTDPIGRAFNFQLTETGLECDAVVFADMPSPDRALSNEVISQLNKGIPLDASILFTVDDPAAVECVPANMKTSVNGLEVSGPCKIYRSWRLRSLTLCRVGADPATCVTITRARKPMEDEELKEEAVAAEEVQAPVEEVEEGQDIDALLALLSELQIKVGDLEARIIALETPAAEEEPAPIEEAPEEAESEEVKALKSSVCMLRHQLIAVMRSNSTTQPVGIVEGTEPHDVLAGSIRYSMLGLE